MPQQYRPTIKYIIGIHLLLNNIFITCNQSSLIATFFNKLSYVDRWWLSLAGRARRRPGLVRRQAAGPDGREKTKRLWNEASR